MKHWIKRLILLALGSQPGDPAQRRRVRALYSASRRLSPDYDRPAYLRRSRA